MSTVELFGRVQRAGALGLSGVESVRLDWGAMIARKNEIVAKGWKGTRASLEKQGITILQGRAMFTGANELQAGEQTITGRRFVIATGSSPARATFEGGDRTITSDELLNLERRPEKMVVIGGGFIGMELGFCLARAGTAVTILQKGPHMAPAADDEIRGALVESGREAGITFHTGVEVKRVAADRTVEAEIKGARERFPADVVLVATGRPPNTAHLELVRAGAEIERGGVKVNEYLQSVSAPHVYAAGDASGHHQQSPIAWYEGQIAARNALRGNSTRVDFSVFPTAVFTIPAIGQVGLTEAEARRRGLNIKVYRSLLKHNPAAGVRNETEGFVKVVYEEGTDRILGVHVFGAHAEDLVQIAAVAMRGGLKRAEVGAMHYIFPTLGGAVFDAMAGW